MRLMLPMSSLEIHTLLSAAANARQSGRLWAIRERTNPNGTVSLSAKFSDSFGFVDHPRLTASEDILLDFRCDCPQFHRTRQFCVHCAGLAAAHFGELSPAAITDNTEETPDQKEQPSVPLKLLVPEDPEPAEESQAPDVTQLSYAFCNCAQHLYPGKSNPRIPLARYYQIFGNNARARMLHTTHRRWGGSCFGMTSTASMFFLPGDPTTVADFRVGATHPADLLLTSRSKELHMTLHTFIEAVHITQYHSQVAIPRNEHLQNPNCLDDLCRRVRNFQQTQTEPVGMAVWRSPKFDGGHSVLPYWLETREDGQDRLYIYDPNHPMETRYAYLEKDAEGHYTNWRFPMNDYTEYSGATGSQLSFDAYVDYKSVWDAREGAQPDALMAVPRNVAILSADGSVLFRISKDGTESFCERIFQMPITDLADDEEELVLLSLPAGSYLVRNEDPERETLRVQLSHEEQSVILSTNARETEVTADDGSMCISAQISQPGCSYSIELDAFFEDDHHMLLLEGTTGADGLRFGCYNGTLRAKGCLTEELASLYIDEELTDLSCIEQEKAVIFQEETAPQKKHLLITNTEQTDPTSAADVTD